MKKDIKSIVAYYKRKTNSNNPFEIAKFLNIEVQKGNLGECSGCYMFLKNHRYIFINQELNEREMAFVMDHELGHAILHRKENCYFIKNKTLLLNSKNEIEGNVFAAELLIPDSLIYENPGMTKSQLARLAGYDEKIMEFKKI